MSTRCTERVTQSILMIHRSHSLDGGTTRMAWVGAWLHAGGIAKHSSAGFWWTAMSEDHWPVSPGSLDAIRKNWQEPFGDRRQKIVFIGTDSMDRAALTAQLDACLLTEAELGSGTHRWSAYEDSFPKWD